MASVIERAADRLHWEITNEGRSIDMAEAKAIVRIVLTAIREPSEGMLKAGVLAPNYLEDQSSRRGCGNIYTAMIDAALKEE